MLPGSFELVAACAFGGGLDDAKVSLGPGGEEARQPPRLYRARDGRLWLVSNRGRAGVLDGGWRERADGAVSIAPVDDGGLVVLGKSNGENRLSRIDGRGAVIWQRSGGWSREAIDFASLRGRFEGLQPDADGSVYLVGAGVTRVQLDDGATASVLAHGQGRWFVGGGWLLQVADGTCVRRALAGGAQQTVACVPELRQALAVAALPDGGLLWVHNHEPIWMAPDGQVRTRLALAGVVRDGDALVVAQRESEGLQVRRWSGGVATTESRLEIAGRARLVGASDGEYQVWLRDERRLIRFSASGAALGDELREERPTFVGALDTAHACVEPDGAVLWAAADPAGVFVVRAR